jgi:hypothetical protein
MTTKGTPQMRRSLRAALLGTAVVATLALAGSALAANTGTVAVWHTPMALGSVQSTTVHFNVPQTTDPVAAVNIYVPSGYRVNASQTVGSNIGNVDATAFSYDNQLTLPLSGTVTVDDPSKHATDSAQCTGVAQSAAVWILNLSVAGNTIALPVYVNPTAGPEAALGAYKLTVCLAPWDIPESQGGAAQGAQVLDVLFTVNGIFTTPTGAGVSKWEELVTPYTPGKGTPNPAGTFEARAFVPLPIALTIKASYVKKTNTWKLSGKATEGGQAVAGLTVRIARGLSQGSVSIKSSTKTDASGNWKTAGHLSPKKTTYFRVSASVGERDFTATGCQSPATTVAPAGCVNATLPKWSATSVVVRVKR